MKNHAFAGVEVGCGNPQRNLQLLKRLHFQCARQKSHHAVVRGEAVTRDGPAGKRSEAAGVRYLFEVFERKSAAIRRANQRTHAGARYQANGNAFFFENFQNPDVGHAARKAAAERDTDRRNTWRDQTALGGELASKGLLYGPDDLAKTLHQHPTFPTYLSSI